MKEQIESIPSSSELLEEKLKEKLQNLDRIFDESIIETDNRQKRILRTKTDEKKYVAVTVSIYDFWTEEDFERNPIP